jgi:hypothetical protein
MAIEIVTSCSRGFCYRLNRGNIPTCEKYSRSYEREQQTFFHSKLLVFVYGGIIASLPEESQVN